MFRRLFILFACIVCVTLNVSAHPGKTDSAGGHYDLSSGEYHYHHGYAAHQHPDGNCPYNTSVEEPSELNQMTFAELWNEGYLCAQDDMIEGTHDAGSKDVIREIFISLYDENQMNINDRTYPEDVGYTEQEAFNEGYNQAIFDYENLPDEDPRDSGYVKTDDGEWALEDSIVEEADKIDESTVEHEAKPVSTLGDSSLEKSSLSLNRGTLLLLVLIAVFCILLFTRHVKRSKKSDVITSSEPVEETDVASASDVPVDLGALKYGPVGTGWLKFLIYIGLPIQAFLNYLGLSSIDVSHVSGSIAYVPYFLLIAYGVSFPLVTAFFLHLRHPRGYFLINYLLFSNVLLNLCLVFSFSYTTPDFQFSYMQSFVYSIAWGLIWFFYIKKRRFLFKQENVSNWAFDNIGAKVSYIIVPTFAVAVASLAYLAYQ